MRSEQRFQFHWRLIAGIIVVCVASTRDVSAADRTDVARLADEVVTAWKKRCETVETAIVDWTETRQYSTFPPAGGKPVNGTRKVRKRFILSGRCWKLVTEGMLWDSVAQKSVPGERIHSFDGRRYYTFGRSPESQKRSYPWGTISDTGGMNYYRDEPGMRPLLMHLRAFDAWLGIVDERRWLQQPAVLESRADGSQVLGIPFRSYPRGEHIEYRFAGEPHWHVQQIGWGRLSQVNIQWAEEKTQSPYPSEWTFELRRRGNSVREIPFRAKVVAWRENIPVSQDTFRLKFPAGTVVTDPSTRPSRMWIVRRDGSNRPISEAERAQGVDYRKLLNERQ